MRSCASTRPTSEHCVSGYTTEVLKVTDMLQNADNKLFSLMFRSVTAFIHYFPTSK